MISKYVYINFVMFFMVFDNKSKALGFSDLINESVNTIDDVDIGDINAANRHFIVVKRGFVNLHYY
jgi:hypothetical protein